MKVTSALLLDGETLARSIHHAFGRNILHHSLSLRIVRMTDVLFLAVRYPWDKHAETFTPTQVRHVPFRAFAYRLEDIYESTISASWARRDDP